MAEEINKNQLLEQKKAVFDMIVEGPKLTGEAQAKEDDQYSLDTERGAQLYASFSDDELLELLRGSTILPLRGRCIGSCVHISKLVSKIGRGHCVQRDWAGRRVGAECPQSRCLRRTRSTSRCSIKFEAWRNSWAESHTRRSCLRYAGN